MVAGERQPSSGAGCGFLGLLVGALLVLSACLMQDLGPRFRGRYQALPAQEAEAQAAYLAAGTPQDGSPSDPDVEPAAEGAGSTELGAAAAPADGLAAGDELATSLVATTATTTGSLAVRDVDSLAAADQDSSPATCAMGSGNVEAVARAYLGKVEPSSPAGGACDDLNAWARGAVAEQLSPWSQTGVTTEMFYGSSNYEPRIGGSSHIEVRGGEVHGDNDWSHYMRRAAKHWPFSKEELKDFKVVSENADWPFMVKGDPRADPSRAGPAFTNANNGHFWNVLMPIQSRPQFGDDFEEKRRHSLALGSKVPWKDRKDVAAWRGNLGCAIGCGHRGGAYFPDNHVLECSDDSPHWDPNKVGFVYGCGEDKSSKRGAWMKHYRVALVRYSVQCGDECGIDAKFPDIGGEHRPFVENYTGRDISHWLGGYMDDERTAAHRYVFHVGNNGYADRSWRMFALGSTVLLVDTGWKEWYFSLLQPFVHYIPVRADASDACEKLHWARAHPEEAEAIAQRGRAFIEGCFTLDLVNQYCAEVMRQLGDLWERGHKRREP